LPHRENVRLASEETVGAVHRAVVGDDDPDALVGALGAKALEKRREVAGAVVGHDDGGHVHRGIVGDEPSGR
jgi:hypothetical protein